MHLERDGELPAVKVEDVVDIARAAGDVIMGVYSTDPETWESRSKSDDTPVTKADVMADELICSRLRSAYPDIPIISEESEKLPYEERRDYDFCWVVDPLDGTKEFVKRTGDFAVMIGLCVHGKPVLGVVHAPAQETPKTYYAASGQGAFVLEGGRELCGKGLGKSKRISARDFGVRDSGLRLAVSSSRPPRAFIASCDSPVTSSIGSAALKAVAVADGTVDMFPCLYPTSEWDTCAPQVLVEEAGGVVLPLDGTGDVGMADVAALHLLLRVEKAPAAAADSAESAVAGGDASVGTKSSPTRSGELHLSYNKADLSSPRCVFLGRCTT
ncbi:unnamed protein product [Ectocarpus sp. 12 AP-2014]